MDAWSTLIAAGLPDGAPRPPPREAPALDALREALVTTLASQLDQRSLELLAAWLGALARHFPSVFARVMGADGERRLSELRRSADANRYLKLRRIAIANLAAIF